MWKSYWLDLVLTSLGLCPCSRCPLSGPIDSRRRSPGPAMNLVVKLGENSSRSWERNMKNLGKWTKIRKIWAAFPGAFHALRMENGMRFSGKWGFSVRRSPSAFGCLHGRQRVLGGTSSKLDKRDGRTTWKSWLCEPNSSLLQWLDRLEKLAAVLAGMAGLAEIAVIAVVARVGSGSVNGLKNAENSSILGGLFPYGKPV